MIDITPAIRAEVQKRIVQVAGRERMTISQLAAAVAAMEAAEIFAGLMPASKNPEENK